MKRIILLAFATSVCTFASAQRLKGADDALDKHVLEVTVEGAAMASLDLQKELNLTQEQYEQVMELNSKRYEQLFEAEQVLKDDEQQLSKAIYTINLETDKALGAMLDPRQFRVYLELEGRQQTRFVSDNAEE